MLKPYQNTLDCPHRDPLNRPAGPYSERTGCSGYAITYATMYATHADELAVRYSQRTRGHPLPARGPRRASQGKEKGERQGAEGGGGTRRSPWPPAARSRRELVAVHARTSSPRRSELHRSSMLATPPVAGLAYERRPARPCAPRPRLRARPGGKERGEEKAASTPAGLESPPPGAPCASSGSPASPSPQSRRRAESLASAGPLRASRPPGEAEPTAADASASSDGRWQRHERELRRRCRRPQARGEQVLHHELCRQQARARGGREAASGGSESGWGGSMEEREAGWMRKIKVEYGWMREKVI
jgi:hypothetical protein